MIVWGMCPARITFCVAGLPKGLTCLYFMWVPGCPCWGRMESKGSTKLNITGEKTEAQNGQATYLRFYTTVTNDRAKIQAQALMSAEEGVILEGEAP